jgi:hypothetical protein
MARLDQHPWETFQRTVEGNTSVWTTKWSSGGPQTHICGENETGGPDPLLLTEMLRSGVPIPPETRLWLASMLDENGDTHARLKLTYRKKGKPRDGFLKHYDAVQRFMHLKWDGTKHEAALAEVMEDFELSRSTLSAAISKYLAALNEHDEANRIEWRSE